MKNKFKKIVALVLLISLITPVLAKGEDGNKADNTKIEIKSPIYSPWAIGDLNEAQFMGVFPSSKFFDGTDFRKAAKVEDLKILNELAINKLKNMDIETGREFEFKNLTRIEVLGSISKILNKKEFSIKDLQDLNIFRGENDEKYLNGKIPLQEAIALYTRAVESRIQEEDRGSRGYFYEIKNKDNTIYLLGSIHVGKREMYPIDQKIKEALKNSSKIYMEVDLTNTEASKTMQDSMYYKGDGNLKSDLGDELFAKVVKILGEAGLKEEDIIKIKPWAVYNSISLDPNGGSGNAMFGVESYFLAQALLNKIEIGELESIEFQKDLLSGFDKEDYVILIKNIVEEIEKNGYKNINSQLSEMQDAWIKGDKKLIRESFGANENDEEGKFNNILVGDRDVNMANKIENLLEQEGNNTYFILVGAAHLVPENSITGILKDRGYEIVDSR